MLRPYLPLWNTSRATRTVKTPSSSPPPMPSIRYGSGELKASDATDPGTNFWWTICHSLLRISSDLTWKMVYKYRMYFSFHFLGSNLPYKIEVRYRSALQLPHLLQAHPNNQKYFYINHISKPLRTSSHQSEKICCLSPRYMPNNHMTICSSRGQQVALDSLGPRDTEHRRTMPAELSSVDADLVVEMWKGSCLKACILCMIRVTHHENCSATPTETATVPSWCAVARYLTTVGKQNVGKEPHNQT